MNIFSFPYMGLTLGSVLGSWLFHKRTRPYWIAAANVVFLFLLRAERQDWLYVLVLTALVYFSGLAYQKTKKKGILLAGIAVCASGLIFYKYGRLDGERLLPLGISFYTFKAISYLADLWKGSASIRVSPVKVFDYICFFPVFMSGPIHRAEPFFKELEEPLNFDYQDQMAGAVAVIFGAYEKFVITGLLERMTQAFQSPSLSGENTVLGMVFYAFYLYTDFDSYSSMAIGTARLLGFHLEPNFRAPYLAASIAEFWRRWHISLGAWLRDYIYIPLGGSRRGALRKEINLLIVFLVSGMWHGSTGVFVVWGLGHGLLSVAEDLLKRISLPKTLRKILRPLAVAVNFVLVTILWVFFSSADLSAALDTLRRAALVFQGTGAADYAAAGVSRSEWLVTWFFLGAVVFCDFLRYRWNMSEKFIRWFIVLRWAVYAVLIATAIIFGNYGPGFHASDFVYSRF